MPEQELGQGVQEGDQDLCLHTEQTKPALGVHRLPPQVKAHLRDVSTAAVLSEAVCSGSPPSRGATFLFSFSSWPEPLMSPKSREHTSVLCKTPAQGSTHTSLDAGQGHPQSLACAWQVWRPSQDTRPHDCPGRQMT